jgi:hypothetical protein
MTSSIPDLHDTLTTLGLSEAEDLVSPHWDESVDTFPSDAIFFLRPEYVTESARFCGMSDETVSVALEMAARIGANPALSRLLWHCHCLTYVHLDYPHAELGRWPLPESVLGHQAGVFYLLAALSGVRQAQEHDRERGIPEQITRDGLYDIGIGVNRFGRFFPGRIGVQPRLLYWFRNHTHYGLHRLGRLQYIVRPFGAPLTIYRHTQSGRVLALCDPGLKFDGDGFRAAPSDQSDATDNWESGGQADGDSILAHPILPTGVALRQPVRLRKHAWEQVLAPGDGILETHIPEGGDMAVERCEASMRQALEFFPKYYPERPFKAIVCQSWIMNPEYESFYSPTANFVEFQRELYLYPTPWARTSGIFFIFDAEEIDPQSAPRDTSIRRAMADHLEQGGVLRSGGMFFFPEEMEAFGSQVYRNTPLFNALRAGDTRKLASVDIGIGDP